MLRTDRYVLVLHLLKRYVALLRRREYKEGFRGSHYVGRYKWKNKAVNPKSFLNYVRTKLTP